MAPTASTAFCFVVLVQKHFKNTFKRSIAKHRKCRLMAPTASTAFFLLYFPKTKVTKQTA